MTTTPPPLFSESHSPRHTDGFKIIAVISICWSALLLLGALPNLISPPSVKDTQEVITQIQNMNPKWAEILNVYSQSQSGAFQTLYSWINFISALLSLTGVVWMWRFKSVGLWMYCAGELLPYILFMNNDIRNGLQSMSSDSGAFFLGLLWMIGLDSLFIFMFRKNLLKALTSA
jgi:hypothetical protein